MYMYMYVRHGFQVAGMTWSSAPPGTSFAEQQPIEGSFHVIKQRSGNAMDHWAHGLSGAYLAVPLPPPIWLALQLG